MTDLNDFIISESGVLTEYLGDSPRITIPDGVKSIDMYVFCGLDNLEEIVIPDSIEAIDDSNFEDCDNLNYNKTDGSRYLGNASNPYLVLVSADEDITELDVKDGCRVIMGNALANNSNLCRLSIPSSVKYIGFMAFFLVSI